MIRTLQHALLLLMFAVMACLGGNTLKRCLCSGQLVFAGEELRCHPDSSCLPCCPCSDEASRQAPVAPSESSENCPGECFIVCNPFPVASLPTLTVSCSPTVHAASSTTEPPFAAFDRKPRRLPRPFTVPDPPRPSLPILFASLLI